MQNYTPFPLLSPLFPITTRYITSHSLKISGKSHTKYPFTQIPKVAVSTPEICSPCCPVTYSHSSLLCLHYLCSSLVSLEGSELEFQRKPESLHRLKSWNCFLSHLNRTVSEIGFTLWCLHHLPSLQRLFIML